MNDIIKWCNSNVGFMNAVMSLIGLFLSTVAIIVSIQTARLPYKKAIKLSQYYDFHYIKNNDSPSVESHVIGMTINAANIGSRNINITFLGLAAKDRKHGKEYKKLVKWDGDITGTGILSPTEISTTKFDLALLLGNLDGLSSNAKIYILAYDSEGKCYHKYIGTVDLILNYLLSNK